MAELTSEIKSYRDTSEKALDFMKELINKLICHEQKIQKQWISACLKWGGWIVAAVIGMIAAIYKA
jgi:hypothetical protein